MDKKNAKLKNTFTNLISHISKMYKEVSNVNNEAYLIGRKEGFEEILNWFVTSHNGELKYISATSFFNMIQEKIAKTKAAIATKLSNDEEEEIKPTINFSEIKISDNRKRINRYAQIDVSPSLAGSNDQMEEEVVISNLPVQPNLNFPLSVNSLLNANNSSNRDNFLIPNLSNLSNISNNLNNIQTGGNPSNLNNMNNQSTIGNNSLLNFPNQSVGSTSTVFSNPFTAFGLNSGNTSTNQQTFQPSLFNINSGTTTLPKKKKK